MLSREVKFIIVRDSDTGLLRHFKSNCLHHYELARARGYDSEKILEAGLFLEGKKYILECLFLEHLKKRENFYIGSLLQFNRDIKLINWLKGRELESNLYFNLPKIYREGD